MDVINVSVVVSAFVGCCAFWGLHVIIECIKSYRVKIERK